MSKTLAEELSEGKDWNDVNTVQGLLNRATEIVANTTTIGERNSFYPIKDPESYKFFKILASSHWDSTEMDFSKDKKDYEALSPPLKHMIDMINCFFSASDGLVINNLDYFLIEADSLESKAFFIIQQQNEMHHSESYSLIINTLVTDENERNKLFFAANHLPCVRNKSLWAETYMKAPIDIQYRRVAFACLEGIQFISSFLGIFYFRSKGLLQNIIFANDLISKDEGVHRDNLVMLYRRGKKMSDENVKKIVTEAVELELQFIDVILPNAVEDLTPESFKNYVRYLGDHLLISLGHTSIWNIKADTLPKWMGEISNSQKGNFYETRNSNYLVNNLSKSLDWQGRISGKYAADNERAYADPSSVNF